MSLSNKNIPGLFSLYAALDTKLGSNQAVWATGQAALESRWFTSALSRQAHNFWGIKATPNWKGAAWNGRTEEFLKGKSVHLSQTFRAYPTIGAGIDDYLSLIDRLYSASLRQSSLTVFLNQLQGRWATDPHYAIKVQQVIQQVETIVKGQSNVS